MTDFPGSQTVDVGAGSARPAVTGSGFASDSVGRQVYTARATIDRPYCHAGSICKKFRIL
ncbi:MAG: hypothetical protein IJN20_07165 [Oscillospiraceae bacterium]|nr:hypothetical protein [Oscillospiraceae bacterium]